jgi:hypothetical protein
VSRPSAADVSARVEARIARHHRGDRCAAARRIGIESERLAGLLSGDWRLFSLDALAALLRRHSISISWLLGTSGGPDETHLGARHPSTSDTSRKRC